MARVLEKANFPTVSEPSAMRDFPDARNRERDVLLEYVKLRPGMVVLDLQAAGGYLSDEVRRRLGSPDGIVCLEPNPELRSRLDPAYRSVGDPLESFDSVSDGSVDVVIGLIGLHHSGSHAATIAECHRVLRPGGELAICDVPQGSRLAEWLNGFVDAYCPAGHDGNFPALGSIARLCGEAGFAEASEELREVPWRFDRRSDIAIFFKGLFGLTAAIETIERSLDEYFVVSETEHGCAVDWQLVYAHARKRS